VNEHRAPVDDEELAGLAGVRTELAWSRTSLSMAVVAAVVLRCVWEQFDIVTARVAVFGILGAAGLAWFAALWWSATVGRSALEGRRLVTPHVLRRVTVATVILAGIALVLAILPYPD
jgi:uncharacterized membrane protein YidH (DUF202 family)